MILDVVDVNLRGEGIAWDRDHPLALAGALPGDTLEATNGAPPRLASLRTRVPQVPCPHPRCPGCPLLGLPYPEQREAKHRLVARSFRERFEPLGLRVPEISAVRPSPRICGYRAGAKLVLAQLRGRAAVGIYERDSHRVVDLRGCPVHHPLIDRGVRALADLLRRAPALVSEGVGGRGRLRYAAFQVSEAEGTLQAVLVARAEGDLGLLRSLAARLRERVPELTGVLGNVNPTQGNEIFSSRWEVLHGEEAIRERIGDVLLRASAGAFLQANREQAGWVYRRARELLAPGPGDDVLDLYCGVGGLGLHLAAGARRLLGVEGASQAVADAAWAAGHAGVADATFRFARVEDAVEALSGEGFRPAVLSLNPPRKGASPEALAAIARLGPRRILYVSCNPETLARDAALLCAPGRYSLAAVEPVDFFPHTAHVETLALFAQA